MAPKLTKNQMRRMKKKEEKKNKVEAIKQDDTLPSEDTAIKLEVDVDTKPEDMAFINNDATNDTPFNLEEEDPNYEMYKSIMSRFTANAEEEEAEKEANTQDKGQVIYSDDEDEEEAEVEKRLSKRKRKEAAKLSVAELKALVRKPELVDESDTRSSDPRLSVHIKSYRNVVPVPAHWSLKREYLSSKRGIEKAAFSLPKFIQETGIAEMRDAVLEKRDEASLKQKQRERVAPKMGKLDIDYQKLYEAFFRHQTKPELTRYGEVYYEGKEYETNLRHLRPGELSDELKEALNIPPGAPPPWLINQQRFGPPPSYPALKIPGLNAPPPPGGAWGFHPGGYGKPPVDEFNRPLYGGDIFGILQPQANNQSGEPIERTLWGELQPPEDEEEEEEEESEAEEEEEADEEEIGAGLETPSGLETPGGMASTVPSEYGVDIGEFDIRKQRRGTDTEDITAPRSAYQIIPEHQTKVQGFFGGDRAYDLKNTGANGMPVLGRDDEDAGRKRKKPGDVDVALDPDALIGEDGMSREELERRYEAGRRQGGVQGVKGSENWRQGPTEDDLTDLIASESRKRQKRDEERRSAR